MFDNYSTNVAFILLGILLFVLPDYIHRFIVKPIRERKRRKLRARVFKVEAAYIIGSYFKKAKIETHHRDIVITGQILECFEKMCPHAISDEGIYNADILEEWIRSSAIKLLISYHGELGKD